jgi:hypothetical protein
MAKNKVKFEVRPSRLAACIRLAGDINAGVLLYCVCLRFNKGWSQLKRDGKDFIAMTGKEFQHYVGYTRHQHDRAIKILKKKNLIVVEHHKVRKSDKFQRTWVHLPDTTVSAIAGIMEMPIDSVMAVKDAPIDSVTVDEETVIDSAVSEHNINDNKEENEEIMNDDLLEKQKLGIQVSDKKGVIEEVVKLKSCRGSKLPDDTIKGFIKTMFEGAGYCPDGTDKLHINAFKSCINTFGQSDYKLAYGGYYYEEWDKFMINEYREVRALQLIVWEWDDFCSFIKLAKGAWNIPASPTLVCIKLHINAAVEFFNFGEWLLVNTKGASHCVFSPNHTEESKKDIIDIYYSGSNRDHNLKQHILDKKLMPKFVQVNDNKINNPFVKTAT